MGSRANHNFKNRQKLIEKHTGKPYKGGDKYGKGGKGGKGAKGAKGAKGGNRGKSTYYQGYDEQWDKTEKRQKRAKDLPKSTTKSGKFLNRLRSKQQSEGAKEGKPSKVKVLRKKRKVRSTSPEPDDVQPKRKKRISKLGRLLVEEAKKSLRSERGGKKVKRVKKVSQDGDGVKKKTKKVKRKVSRTLDSSDDEKSTKKYKGAKRVKDWSSRRFYRRRAFVICPGSVTERAARGPLNDNERRLLQTGPLSWQWLRDEDPDESVKARALAPNPRAHWRSLEQHLSWLSTTQASRLKWLDTYLETLALWPECEDRVALALRLFKKGGIRRRCSRHLAEVVSPLLAEVGDATIWTDTRGLWMEAHKVCIHSAQKWEKAQHGACRQSLDTKGCHHVWMQMLMCSLAPCLGHNPTQLGAWLKCAIFSRLCPWHQEETQLHLLKSVCKAAADEVTTVTSSGDVEPGSSEIVMLPLGMFSFWQVILLVGAVKWLKKDAVVVRRTAAGSSQVIFRTLEATAPAKASGAAH